MTGDQTHVFYDIDCRKPCEDEKKCTDEACGSEVIFTPRKYRLDKPSVFVGNLYLFENYIMKIYATNRVSELARVKHGNKAKFTEITIRTNGSG